MLKIVPSICYYLLVMQLIQSLVFREMRSSAVFLKISCQVVLGREERRKACMVVTLGVR